VHQKGHPKAHSPSGNDSPIVSLTPSACLPAEVGRGPQVDFSLERPPNRDGYALPRIDQDLKFGSGSLHPSWEWGISRLSQPGRSQMGLNPNASVWTPGLCGSRERGEGGGLTAQRVGIEDPEWLCHGPSRRSKVRKGPAALANTRI